MLLASPKRLPIFPANCPHSILLFFFSQFFTGVLSIHFTIKRLTLLRKYINTLRVEIRHTEKPYNSSGVQRLQK